MTPIQSLLFVLGCCLIGVATVYLLVPAITYISVAVIKLREAGEKKNGTN